MTLLLLLVLCLAGSVYFGRRAKAQMASWWRRRYYRNRLESPGFQIAVRPRDSEEGARAERIEDFMFDVFAELDKSGSYSSISRPLTRENDD